MYTKIIILHMLFWGISSTPSFAQATDGRIKIRINPELSSGGEAAQFIDSINFTPLENSKESHFRSIFQLAVDDRHFVILDKETNAILIFTRSGHFHAKIKVMESVYQFNLNKKKNQIEVPNYPEILIYNLEGELIKKDLVSNRPNTLAGVTKIPLGDKYTAYYNTDFLAKDSLIYQILIYENDRIVNYFMPYPKGYQLETFDHLGFVNFGTNLNDTDSGVYYIKNFDYTVYRLTPSSFAPVYEFVFPMQISLPKNFSDTAYNGKRMAFFQNEENQAVIPRLYRFYKQANLLFFSEGKYSYIFNEKKQELVCVNKIRADSLSYFLPVTESDVDAQKNAVYLNFDGNFFYFSCSSEAMYSKYVSTKNKKINYPVGLSKYFDTMKSIVDGNPVLVQVKFKSNLN